MAELQTRTLRFTLSDRLSVAIDDSYVTLQYNTEDTETVDGYQHAVLTNEDMRAIVRLAEANPGKSVAETIELLQE